MFWEIYEALCRARGCSANAVARELSIASGTVTEWKKGRMPQNATLKRLAEYFGVSADYLLGRESTAENSGAEVRGLQVPVYDVIEDGVPIEVAAVPKRGLSQKEEREDGDAVSAGIPLSDIGDATEYEEIPQSMCGEASFLAFRIGDDSMEPRMMKGDVVIVRCQSTFEDGDTVLVFLGGHAACRRLRRTEGGMLFIASNPDYEPVFFPENASADKKCRILGRVIELRAKY